LVRDPVFIHLLFAYKYIHQMFVVSLHSRNPNKVNTIGLFVCRKLALPVSVLSSKCHCSEVKALCSVSTYLLVVFAVYR